MNNEETDKLLINIKKEIIYSKSVFGNPLKKGAIVSTNSSRWNDGNRLLRFIQPDGHEFTMFFDSKGSENGITYFGFKYVLIIGPELEKIGENYILFLNSMKDESINIS